jgi:hypothetical protein
VRDSGRRTARGAIIWQSGSVLTILRRGVSISAITITGGHSRHEGGGIRIIGDDRSVTLTNSTVTGSTAGTGGGIYEGGMERLLGAGRRG